MHWHPILFAALLLTCATPAEQLVAITELLKNPAGNEDAIPGGKSHEFVEFANLGNQVFSTDSLFLSNGVKVDSVVPWTVPLSRHATCIIGSRLIPPGRSAVILDPDYAGAPSASMFNIDSGTVLFTVDHTSLVDGLSAGDGVFLYKGSRTRIDRVVAAFTDSGQACALGANKVVQTSPTGIREGFSLVPSRVLMQPSTSTASPESLSLGHYERVKNGWLAEWQFGLHDTAVHTLPCSLACLRIGDSTGAQRSASWTIVSSRPGSTPVAGPEPFAASSGTHRFSVSIPVDSVLYLLTISENDIPMSTWDIDISGIFAPLTALKITEVSPRATSSVPEWFELTNVSQMPITIARWTFGNSESRDTLGDQALTIAPGTYFVFTSDRTAFLRTYPALASVTIQPPHWHSLDNYNDTLALWDSHTMLCEKVAWSSSWFDSWNEQTMQRVSLDKNGLDRAAWVLGAVPSPGQPNQAVAWRSAVSPSLRIGPTPFTPNGDGVDDALAVSVTLPANATICVSIYGFDGVKIRDFPDPPQKQYLWDGTDGKGHRAPLGPFFVVAEITTGGKKNLLRAKGILWR